MASLCHHIAVQVADLDRSIAFYADVFGARLLTAPRRLAGERAGEVMGGSASTAFRVCRLGFDTGCLELFEFDEAAGAAPGWALDRTPGRLPHFGVEVTDVMAALERLERAGGRRLWQRPEQWGRAQTMYAADPDGNVFELCDVSLQEIVTIVREMFAEDEPAPAAR